MEELITTFHIDLKLMIAQVVNFGLVFMALYFIAAKPLRKLIEDRTLEINTGLDNAKEARNALENANLEKEGIIREAKNSAKNIMIQSQADGKEIVKEAKDRATIEREEMIKQAKLDAEKEKKIANDAVQKEASQLVAEGVKKIMESYVAKGKGEDIINAILPVGRQGLK
ncbi:F0F1 ATP synthase subunit B [Patescibacteria group bacterium]|nr:F0F1 ATP synthase subunit B [Patescibacteria group bacterium]MBU1727923.1 F0F1 ATP synthase subunit B [Patescibacteria group bacterium]